MPGKFSIFDGRDFQKGGMIMIRFLLRYRNIYWVLGWNRKTVTMIGSKMHLSHCSKVFINLVLKCLSSVSQRPYLVAQYLDALKSGLQIMLFFVN